MKRTARLGGVRWAVVPARWWPNVAWLEAEGHGVQLVFERSDGLWGCSDFELVPFPPLLADVALRRALGTRQRRRLCGPQAPDLGAVSIDGAPGPGGGAPGGVERPGVGSLEAVRAAAQALAERDDVQALATGVRWVLAQVDAEAG